MQQQMRNEYPWQPKVIADRGEEETTIDLLEVFYLFWGHLRQIVVCLVLGAAVGALYAWGTGFRASSQCQATAQVFLASAAKNSDDIVTILSKLPSDEVLAADVADAIDKMQNLPDDDSLIADYKALLLSRPLLQDVIENLSLDINSATLENMVTISDLDDTHILNITVTGSNANEVADIANELVSQGKIYYQDYLGLEPPKLLASAMPPTEQLGISGSEYSKKAALGSLIAVILYCGFILVRFLMDDTIVTPNDVMECFGVQPLAVIPESNFGNNQQHKAKKCQNQ